GRFAEADKLRREAFASAQEAGDRNSVIHFLGAMAWSLLVQGRVAEVVGPAAAAAGLYPRVAGTVHSVLACAWAYLGDVDNAREQLSLAGPPDELSSDILSLLSLVGQAEAAIVVGDASRAARLYDLLFPFEDLWVTVAHLSFIGSVGCFLGSLASMLGRHDAAVAHLRNALARHESAEVPVPMAMAQVKLAAALVARGGEADVPEGEALARRALASADELCLWTIGRLARQVLDARSQPGPESPSPVTRRDRGRSRLTASARHLVGRLSRDRDDTELLRRFGGTVAQRTLFTAMAKSFQPTKAFGFHGPIQFEVLVPRDDDPAEPATAWWTIDVQDRRAVARHERSTAPVTTVRTELPDLIRLLAGELHPLGAVIEGRVHIEGDVLSAVRIPDMFGGLDAYVDVTPGDG
ncbi:MAG: SCP2 sterol-binding domain-containing protein, partial [Acidimicrobiia bacterium]|nr:SCP2 sterol-binding domain-containing protein [Acidimicrobiia bacterium]